MSPIRSSSLTQEVYRHLRDSIVRGDLADGAPLTEEKLAADLGISRTPIREALLRLASDELIDARRGRTPVVRVITKQDAMHLLDAYWAVARAAYEQGAAHLGEADLDMVEDRIDQYAKVASAGEEQQAMLFLGQAFHRVFDASGNPVLVGLINSLQPRIARVVRMRYPEGLGVAAIETYRQELRALRERRVDDALALFDASWHAMRSAISDAYDHELERPALHERDEEESR